MARLSKSPHGNREAALQELLRCAVESCGSLPQLAFATSEESSLAGGMTCVEALPAKHRQDLHQELVPAGLGRERRRCGLGGGAPGASFPSGSGSSLLGSGPGQDEASRIARLPCSPDSGNCEMCIAPAVPTTPPGKPAPGAEHPARGRGPRLQGTCRWVAIKRSGRGGPPSAPLLL